MICRRTQQYYYCTVCTVCSHKKTARSCCTQLLYRSSSSPNTTTVVVYHGNASHQVTATYRSTEGPHKPPHTSNFSECSREVMASICLDRAFFSRAHTPTVILPSDRHKLPRHAALWPFHPLPISMPSTLRGFDLLVWNGALLKKKSLPLRSTNLYHRLQQ